MKIQCIVVVALCLLINYTRADNNTSCIISGSGTLKISCQNGHDINKIDIRTINIDNVHTLDATLNNLTTIPIWICEFKNLVKLDLSKNNIMEIPHDIFQCDESPNFPSMQIIDLSYNKIRRIPSGIFNNLVINALIINNNEIEDIEQGVFSKEHNFYHINCSYNRLTSLDSIFLQLLAQDPPWELSTYKRFDFSHNEVYKFHYTGFELDFNKVYNFHFNLQYNKFKYINLDLFRPFNINDLSDLITLFSINGFLYIDFSNNPILCDCNMYETKTMLLQMFSFPYIPRIFKEWAMQSTVCMYPADVSGNPVTTLDDSKLVCNVTEECPEKCTCIRKPCKNRLEVDCSNQNLKELPNNLPVNPRDSSELINLDMSGNSLSELKNRSYLPNLGTFDVSSNRLHAIAEKALNNLNNIHQLYLHENRFSKLPSKMKDMPFPNLSNLTLHGNQLICDCTTVWLKSWLWALTEHKRLHYPRMITCSENGDIIMEHDFHEDLCNINWGLVVGLPMLCVTLVVACLITMYCFRNVIVLFIRKRREYKENPEGKEFDVFVGYVTQDVMWIRNVLIPLLEPKYKLCIHNRDFEVGKPIMENIANSIEKSQRSIMVLSPRFLESGWCKEEFLVAHRQYMLNPSQVLIPILLPGFDATQDMPSHVKCYLQAHTYLKSDDPWFDKKIKDQMPHTSITEYEEEMNNKRHLPIKIDNNDDVAELNDVIPDAIRVSTISNGTVIPNILNGHIPNENPQNGHGENGHIQNVEGLPNGHIDNEQIRNGGENIQCDIEVNQLDKADINIV